VVSLLSNFYLIVHTEENMNVDLMDAYICRNDLQHNPN
jgi:hypothetical protein